MSDSNLNSDERQKKIDNIYNEIIQQLKEGSYKEAVSILNRALKRYPENKQLLNLHCQLKLKIKNAKIKKLENEAAMLIQKGSVDEGQKKLREIYQLDPSRTDLKESVERKLRDESQEEYYSTMRKDTIKRLILVSVSIIVLIAITSVLSIGWSNHKKVNNAKQYIANGQYARAVEELKKCESFIGGQKPDLENQLLTISDDFKKRAQECLDNKAYEEAIRFLRDAQSAHVHQVRFDDEIKNIRDLQQAERAAKAAAQKSKQDCENALRKARDCGAEVEAHLLWAEAQTLFDAAQACLNSNEFIQAQDKWSEASEKYDAARVAAVKIKGDRTAAVSDKERCQDLFTKAQKLNAEVEAAHLWEQASVSVSSAKQYFENKQFIQARQAWQEAASIYQEALDMARRSPSYLKAQEQIAKWRDIKTHMSETSVRSLLGDPKCCCRESDKSTLYYQNPPQLVLDNNGKVSVVEPTCGLVRFTNCGLDVALKNAEKVYEKEQLVTGRRYEAELKRAQRNYQNDPTELKKATMKISSDYDSQLNKVMGDYNLEVSYLHNGITPISPVYVVSEWTAPDPEGVASLLACPEELIVDSVEKWQVPENWKKLKMNMDRQSVERILGLVEKPSFTPQLSSHYGSIPGFAELKFKRRDDGDLRLDYWKEPLWPSVWEELRELSGSIEGNINPAVNSQTERTKSL